MLNVTELHGFNAISGGYLSADDDAGYLVQSGNQPGTTLTASRNVTLPEGTKSVIVLTSTQINGYQKRYVTSVKIDLVSATKVKDTIRAAQEYNCHTAVWCLNVPAGGVVSLETTHDYNAAFGEGLIWTVIALPVEFTSYTPTSFDTDEDASDPLDCNANMYKDGFAVAVWRSYPSAATTSYFRNSVSIASARPGGAAWHVPTADATSQLVQMEDGAGGNDGQTAVVCSWDSSKFS